ncbi:MAG: hypothetical protein ACI9R3_002312 [Verrucomicrobiales bacterium]|jgi:hypothetical protein
MTFKKLFSDFLRDPEYLYLLIEPIFIYGVAIGTFFFLVTWLAKNSAARITALIVLAGSCLMIFPYLQLREKAEPIPTPPGTEKWMVGAQTERRASTQWVYFTMAGIAVLCTFMGSSGKPSLIFGILTVTGGLSTLVFSIWLHMHEVRIYHPNLRTIKKKEKPSASLGHEISGTTFVSFRFDPLLPVGIDECEANISA